MSEPIVFLTVDSVLAVHARMIDEFGGDPGLRDRGLLESAVGLPAARFGGEFLHHGIPAMAAACLFHVCKNHAFVDGNKRTALAAAEVFLVLNGHRLLATDAQLETLTVGVADGSVAKEQAVVFMQAHVGAQRG
jgi:death on curing protein